MLMLMLMCSCRTGQGADAERRSIPAWDFYFDSLGHQKYNIGITIERVWIFEEENKFKANFYLEVQDCTGDPVNNIVSLAFRNCIGVVKTVAGSQTLEEAWSEGAAAWNEDKDENDFGIEGFMPAHYKLAKLFEGEFAFYHRPNLSDFPFDLQACTIDFISKEPKKGMFGHQTFGTFCGSSKTAVRNIVFNFNFFEG